MKRITVVRTNAGWVADFHNDSQVNTLFGCSLLPTAFTAKASPDLVMREIARLNPGCSVDLIL